MMKQNKQTKTTGRKKMVKVNELGQVKHNMKNNKPTKADRKKIKQLRKFKRNNS